jgi:ribosome biogenesis GTPase
MNGLVIRGSRNIFTVRVREDAAGEKGAEGKQDKGEDAGRGDVRYLECRIKGKILRGVGSYYNPLAPGDRVTLEAASSLPALPGLHGGPQGRITGLLERRTVFARKNQKALGANRAAGAQILAANIDLVLVVTTPALPPFRPRFLDRLLIQAETAEIPAVILCNKQDLADSRERGTLSPEARPGEWLDVEERLEDFKRIGYPVLRISAKTGEGIEELRELIRGRSAVLAGQSGVGKSSIINALFPQANVRVGNLNEKYDRGNHTTTLGELIEIPEPRGAGETLLIDTPGLRRFVPDGVSAEDLVFSMREFAPLAGQCSYGLSCTHRTEPGCKILEAVSAGIIHEERYDSFLRIAGELAEDRR